MALWQNTVLSNISVVLVPKFEVSETQKQHYLSKTASTFGTFLVWGQGERSWGWHGGITKLICQNLSPVVDYKIVISKKYQWRCSV